MPITTRLQERRSLGLETPPPNGADNGHAAKGNGQTPKADGSGQAPAVGNGHTNGHAVVANGNGTVLANGGHPIVSAVASSLPSWIVTWLIVSGVICAFDSLYTSWRPYTLPNGWIGKNFLPYRGWHYYGTIDLRYADASDVATLAQGRVMWIEVGLNFLAAALARRGRMEAVLLAFSSSLLVAWKTLIFLALYVAPPPGARNFWGPSASAVEKAVFFWALNGIWVVVPLLVVVKLWSRLLPKSKMA